MEDEVKLKRVESLGNADQQATVMFRSEMLEGCSHNTLLDPDETLVSVNNNGSLATLKSMVDDYQDKFKQTILNAMGKNEDEIVFNDLVMLTPYEVIVGNMGDPNQAYRYTLCGVDISDTSRTRLTIRQNNVVAKKGQPLSIKDVHCDEVPDLGDELFSGVRARTLDAQLFSRTSGATLSQQLFPGSREAAHDWEIPVPEDFPLDTTDERVRGIAFQPTEDYMLSLRRMPKHSALYEGDLKTIDVGDNSIWFVKK